MKEVIKDPSTVREQDAKIISENDLSVDDVVVAVFGHEIDHDTVFNKKQRDKEERQGGSRGKFNSETVPQITQTIILQDIANKKKKGS